MIYDDYIAYTDEYRNKYGYETVVFLQVGDFFELYAVQNDMEKVGADIFRVGELCNLQVTRKNKSVMENNRSNPYMAGFPLPIVQKHIQTLTQYGYTIVVIRQVTPPPNVKREVTEIVSPSTNVLQSSVDSNYLMTCFFEYENNLLQAGLAGLDVTTGQSFVYEAYSSKQDPSFALDESYRLLTAYSPKEVVVIGEVPESTQKHILELFQGQSCCIQKRWGEPLTMFRKCSYQNQVLQKAFPSSKTHAGLISCVEACHLEKLDVARTAFVYMIQFAYEHNERLVDSIHIPHILESKTSLTLEYNSALQLNLISCMQGDKALVPLLNRCGTAFGSRLFKDRLLAPVTCPKEIARRHSLIDRFATLEYTNHVMKHISQIQDLERLSRRMILGSFSPLDWYSMHTSLSNALGVAMSFGEMSTEWQSLIDSYVNVLDLDTCSKYVLSDIKGNVFRTGVHKDLDTFAECWAQQYNAIQSMAEDITACDVSGGDACLCRVECNDRDGYYLVITKKRWENARKTARMDLSSFDAKPLSSSSTVLRVTSVDIQKASDRIMEAQRKLSSVTTSYFKAYVTEWILSHQEVLQQCVSWLADVDVACSNAKNAFEYGYVKPVIVDGPSSFVHCQSMRHPIIERLHVNVDYVGNDIQLGGDSKYNSLLLYGINSSGKSSFMKAIGLNVIMAQAGMYVACASMTLCPYKHVFTRISGADNIYRGMSSFTVEMTELNNILHRCDQHSLVLGDELCAGTEATSGLAIVAAGIHYLSTKTTSFVFATHLHELVELPVVQAIDGVRIAHMHIEIDPVTKSITYHRKLQDGQGSSVYGLEVCDALGLPRDFMKVADSVRRHIQSIPNELVSQKPSRYNRNVLVDACQLCGERATETHHIRYQCNMGGAVGVHRASNLVALCEACHLKEHTGQISIRGYIQSSSGIQLALDETSPHNTEASVASSVDEVKSILRCGSSGWKMKAKNGVWKKTSDTLVERKLGALLKITQVDMCHWRSVLFDPSL